MFEQGHAVAVGVSCTPRLSAGGGSSGAGSAAPPPAGRSAQAGSALFVDVSLAASGPRSCGTCPSPSTATSVGEIP